LSNNWGEHVGPWGAFGDKLPSPGTNRPPTFQDGALLSATVRSWFFGFSVFFFSWGKIGGNRLGKVPPISWWSVLVWVRGGRGKKRRAKKRGGGYFEYPGSWRRRNRFVGRFWWVLSFLRRKSRSKISEKQENPQSNGP